VATFKITTPNYSGSYNTKGELMKRYREKLNFTPPLFKTQKLLNRTIRDIPRKKGLNPN
jgi:hypothetical protein